MKRAAPLLLLPLLLLTAPALAAPAAMDEPRAYGHVIGDLLTRQARVPLPEGRALRADGLPQPGRINTWLELQSVQLEPVRNGAQVLRLNYQVVNVGPAVVTTTLPALRLPLSGDAAGSSMEAIELPDWPVHLSPLTPRFAVARAGLEALQPDMVPQRINLAPRAWRLGAYALLACALAWPSLAQRWPQLAPWRRRRPFHAAWRDMRALKKLPREQAQRQAIERLHRAFNLSAGRAVFAQQLDALYQAQPALRKAAAEIDAFYAHSQQVFFAQQEQAAEPWTLDQLRALAQTLARVEART